MYLIITHIALHNFLFFFVIFNVSWFYGYILFLSFSLFLAIKLRDLHTSVTDADLFDSTLGFFAKYDNAYKVDVVGFDNDVVEDLFLGMLLFSVTPEGASQLLVW